MATQSNAPDVSGDRDKFTLEFLMDRNIAQLNAMLVAVSGGGAESFDGMTMAVRDDYLWACHTKLEEIQALWRELKGSASEADVAIARAKGGRPR